MQKLLTDGRFWTGAVAVVVTIIGVITAAYFPEQKAVIASIVAPLDGFAGVIIAILFGVKEGVKAYTTAEDNKLLAQISPTETYAKIMAGRK